MSALRANTGLDPVPIEATTPVFPFIFDSERVKLRPDELTCYVLLKSQFWVLVDSSSDSSHPLKELGLLCRFHQLLSQELEL